MARERCSIPQFDELVTSLVTAADVSLSLFQPSERKRKIYAAKLLRSSWSSWLYVLQPRNFSRYHTCPLISVGAPSATALLQHGIQFLLPLKIVPPYIHRVRKKGATLFLPVTQRNVNQFSKFFYHHALQ